MIPPSLNTVEGSTPSPALKSKRPPMNSLYVRFRGDNDFSKTVRAFVEAIAPRILLEDVGWANITKKQVVELFNATAESLFRLHQGRLGDLPPPGYLEIDEADVYFGDEFNSFTDFNHDGCLAVLTHDGITYLTV